MGKVGGKDHPRKSMNLNPIIIESIYLLNSNGRVAK